MQALQQLLEVTPANKKALERVEASILTVCLDDVAPISTNEVCRALWHGDGRNRFFDKSIQLIVFANGKAGMNGEVGRGVPQQVCTLIHALTE